MQAVLAIILVALLGGLLWSLWFVVTNPRRRARQVAAELAAPVFSNPAPLIVSYRRWVQGGAALWFAILLGDAVTRTHDAAVAVVAVAIFAPVVAWAGWLAISGRPVLVIGGDGIIVSRRRRRLRWEDIETIAIEEGSGFAGVETYSLVLHVASESVEPPERRLGGVVTIDNETITTPLQLLSPSWHEIARAIHERSGRQPIVPSRYTRRASTTRPRLSRGERHLTRPSARTSCDPVGCRASAERPYRLPGWCGVDRRWWWRRRSSLPVLRRAARRVASVPPGRPVRARPRLRVRSLRNAVRATRSGAARTMRTRRPRLIATTRTSSSSRSASAGIARAPLVSYWSAGAPLAPGGERSVRPARDRRGSGSCSARNGALRRHSPQRPLSASRSAVRWRVGGRSLGRSRAGFRGGVGAEPLRRGQGWTRPRGLRLHGA